MSSAKRMKLSRARKANANSLFLAASVSEPSTVKNYSSSSLDSTCQYEDTPNSDISDFFKDSSDSREEDCMEAFFHNNSDFGPVDSSDHAETEDEDVDIPNIHFDTKIDLLEQLNEWFIKTQPHTLKSYTNLLKLLKNFHPELPACAATALRSLKKSTYSTMNNFEGRPGLYAYYGLVTRMSYIFEHSQQFREFIKCQTMLDVIISTDGVDLFSCSSTKQGIWPISCKILSRQFNVPPITFGCFQGTSKPAQEFLIDLSHELSVITRGSVQIGDHELKIRIVGFSCDSPARCFCKNIKGSNSRQGCERCDCKAAKVDYVMTFDKFDLSTLRTNEKFRELCHYLEHHKGIPPILMKIDSLDMVLDFFLDALHLCDQGATKRYTSKLMGKAKRASVIQMSEGQISRLEAEMLTLKSSVSNDFQRPLVLVKFYAQWKGCTFRDFALYFAPLLLKPLLSDRVYAHFLKYSVALRILRSRSLTTNEAMLDVAQRLLNEFVSEYDSIIGYKDTVYCIHSLIHLPSDVRRTKLPLDDLSTYHFENSYRYLRDKVKASVTPLAQIEKRLYEFDRYFKVFKIFYEEPEVELNRAGNIKSLRYQYFHLKVNSNNDSFCCVKGKTVKLIDVKVDKDDKVKYLISVEVFRNVKSFFVTPVDSAIVGIYVVENTKKVISVPLKCISNKVYVFPYKDKQVSFPALHSI